MVPTKNLLYNLYIMVLINISGVAALIACRNEKINRVYYLYSYTLSTVSPLHRKTTDLIAKTFRLTSAHQVERIDGQVISVIFASERSHPATTSYVLLCPLFGGPQGHTVVCQLLYPHFYYHYHSSTTPAKRQTIYNNLTLIQNHASH